MPYPVVLTPAEKTKVEAEKRRRLQYETQVTRMEQELKGTAQQLQAQLNAVATTRLQLPEQIAALEHHTDSSSEVEVGLAELEERYDAIYDFVGGRGGLTAIGSQSRPKARVYG